MDRLAVVESNATMTTHGVNFDDVPLRQVYCVVGSYRRCTRTAIIAVHIHNINICFVTSAYRTKQQPLLVHTMGAADRQNQI